MKKTALLLSFLVLAVLSATSQTLDSIPAHSLGRRWAQTTTMSQMADGSLLGGTLLVDGPNSFLGYVLHKVSVQGMVITDTLIVTYPEHLPWHLTAKDPLGEGNILAELGSNWSVDSCYLKIFRFDDELHIDSANQITVPLGDFVTSSALDGLLLDPLGDLIVNYQEQDFAGHYFARIGTDGTVKKRIRTTDIVTTHGREAGPVVFSKDPLLYCYWGSYTNEDYTVDLNMYVLDTAFNVTNSYNMPINYSEQTRRGTEYYSLGTGALESSFLGWDNGDFVVAHGYHTWTYSPNPEYGVILMKYDSDFNLLKTRRIPVLPFIDSWNFPSLPIGLQRSADGNLFLAYYSHDLEYRRVSVVKLDPDLNIIWQRFCLDPGFNRNYARMIVLDNNAVAVMGINQIMNSDYTLHHTEVFYVIVNDDYDGIEKQDIVFRPYTFYPNPVKDLLRMEFSPDVQPVQIELYDLQGRLVGTQRNGLGNVDMSRLPFGTYMMRVTLEDGKTFVDKVVKE